MSNGANADRVVSAGRVRGPHRVNAGREFEVRYWSARLGCTADELRGAIRVVGNSTIARVRAYVADRHGAQTSLRLRGAFES